MLQEIYPKSSNFPEGAICFRSVNDTLNLEGPLVVWKCSYIISWARPARFYPVGGNYYGRRLSETSSLQNVYISGYLHEFLPCTTVHNTDAGSISVGSTLLEVYISYLVNIFDS